jgi:hypothetical protein
LYLHQRESNADYLTGFLTDAKSNKTNMIDLTDLSNEQLNIMLKQTLLTFGLAGSDRMCGNTAGKLKNVGHDPVNTGVLLSLANGESIRHNEWSTKVDSGAINNFLWEANQIGGLFALFVDVTKTLWECQSHPSQIRPDLKRLPTPFGSGTSAILSYTTPRVKRTDLK